MESKTKKLLGPTGLNMKFENTKAVIKKIKEDYEKERKSHAENYQ